MTEPTKDQTIAKLQVDIANLQAQVSAMQAFLCLNNTFVTPGSDNEKNLRKLLTQSTDSAMDQVRASAIAYFTSAHEVAKKEGLTDDARRANLLLRLLGAPVKATS